MSRFDANYQSQKKANPASTPTITYLQDPWGYSYGYSTAGLKDEQDYRVELEKDKNADRPSSQKGFNPTFDIWSTAGSTGPKNGTTNDQERNKWVKNW